MEKIKILLVDDHTVVIKGLGFFLGTQPNFEIVGEAHNGEEALEQVAALQPDVVLMDLIMPVMNGVQATTEIKKRYPHVKVLVLTSFSDHDQVLPALRAGAMGYLLKDVQPDQLVEAIRGAYSGNIQLHPEISNQLMSQLTSPNPTAAQDTGQQALESLTTREHEVLCLIAVGMNNKEIAHTLQITDKTVKTHVSSILGKLGVTDRTQAALLAVKHDLHRKSYD